VPTRRIIANGCVTTTALLFAAWAVVIEPVARAGHATPLGGLVHLAYPLSDVFVIAMLLTMLPRARADVVVFLRCATAGIVLFAVGDIGFALQQTEAGAIRFGWPNVTFQAGICVLIYAFTVKGGPVRTGRGAGPQTDRWLTLVPVAVALTMGVHNAVVTDGLELDDALVGAVMIVAIVVRQYIVTEELARGSDAYRHAAAHDHLTGLANRAAFIRHLAEHGRTPGVQPLAVLLVDLDGFKEVNDTLGHHHGDAVLIEFADLLSAAAAPHLTARLGGDEFAVLVVGDDPEDAARVIADRVHRVNVVSARGIAVSFSAGIARLRRGYDPADVLRSADLAMYTAKRTPGGSVRVFTDRMEEQAQRRHLLVAALPGAIGRGELSLVYQLMYRLSDGSVAGAETLLRWSHPLYGEVPPDEFIPLAEENGHVTAIGNWVLDGALARLAAWDEEGRHLPRLFVNAAGAQFTDELPPTVSAASPGTGSRRGGSSSR
jgi:diguanylate cyclase (GGDEF)-like protein